jgi:glycosyltransferase involved in cell wall biosynthesis
MRILYFVQYFNLPHEPGGSRAYQFARAWTRQGHQVTIVTGAVNHKTLTVPEKYRGRLVTAETVDGIRVLRVWSYAGIRGSYRKRFLNFLSFAAVAGLVGVARAGPADLVYASSTPLTVGLPGRLAAVVRGAPFFFEVRDLWPQSAIVAGVLKEGSRGTRLASKLARWLYARASKVVAVTRGIRDGLVREGVPPGSTMLVPNGVDDWMVDAARRGRPAPPAGRFTVAYCGAHGKWNGLGQLIDAAAILADEPSIEFVFIGDGDEKEALEARAAAAGLTRVRFLGALPKTEAFDALCQASCCVVVTWNHPFQRMVLANKIFDYLAAGRPVVVAAEGEMAELVREAQCGRVVPPEVPELLADAIRQLAALDPAQRERLGAAGRRYILEHYRREDLARELSQAFSDATGLPAEPLADEEAGPRPVPFPAPTESRR